MTIDLMKKNLAVTLALILTGCASAPAARTPKLDPAVGVSLEAALRSFEAKDEIKASAAEGLSLIRRGRYAAAGKSFERGLRLDPTDGALHFLNALTYHLRSLSGDREMLELARSGYEVALLHEPSNARAAYFLGHVYFQQREYDKAADRFAAGLLYSPGDADLLHGLAAAAYYTRDLAVGSWAAERAFKTAPDAASARAAMFTRAARGDIAGAKAGLETYQKLAFAGGTPPLVVDAAAKRVADWERAHKEILLAQYSGDSTPQGVTDLPDAADSGYDASEADRLDRASQAPAASSTPAATPVSPGPASTPPASAKKKNLPKMTLVDVVILRTEENRNQAKGVNLLDGIKATLTGTLYAYSRVIGYSSGRAGADENKQTIAPSFALAGLKYNLNIFNDGVNKAEVLARPSLLAVENKSSKFFSGSTLHVQLNSNNSDGSLVDVPVGIRLEVSPEFLDDETVKVTVHAERNFIETNDEKLGFTVFSQTSKTSVDATAVLGFDETLVLSGLQENEDTTSRSGVPLLGRIPFVQWFFSRKETAQTKKSILILLSPHKPRYADSDMSKVEAKRLADRAIQRRSHLKKLMKKENIVATDSVDAVFDHLERSALYREFRHGDLHLNAWYAADSLIGAVKRALGFLYY